MEDGGGATAEDVLNHMLEKVAHLRHESRRMQKAVGVIGGNRTAQLKENESDCARTQLLEQTERIDLFDCQLKQMNTYLQQMATTHRAVPVKKEEMESASPVFRTENQIHGTKSATATNTTTGLVPGAEQGLVNEPNHMENVEANLYSARVLLDAEGSNMHGNLGSDDNRCVPPTKLAASLACSLHPSAMEDLEYDFDLATLLFDDETSEAEGSANFRHDGGSSTTAACEHSGAVLGFTPTKLAHSAPSHSMNSSRCSNGDSLKHDLYGIQQERDSILTSEVTDRGATTAMIKNIACRFNTEDVKMVLDTNGFHGKYDAVRVPIKCSSKKQASNWGYCFVNFIHPSFLVECAECFDGQRFGSTQSKKVCHVTLAAHQGLALQSQVLCPKRGRRAANRLASSEQMHDIAYLY